MADYADLIFSGGPVYTATADRRRVAQAASADGAPVTAVAVKGGQITALGTEEEGGLADVRGPRTEVVDLRGRALLPGFQDAHVHPVFAGTTMMTCNLIGSKSVDEAIRRIGAYASAHTGKEWITGSGWRMEWFEHGTPSRRQLDAVAGDRPAFLTNRDGHGAWVNSRALELAGIDAQTPDPADGLIERETNGLPQGTLHEGAADLVGAFAPKPPFAERLTGLMLAQEHMHARGVTAWQDAIVGEYLGSQDPLPVYLEAASAGTLTARVRGALWWDRRRDGGQLDEILERRKAGQTGRFSAGTVKIMQDGVAENYTAAMIEPYLDSCGCQTERRGLSHVDAEELKHYVTLLDAAGFQVHFHAIGDRAVRECLDAAAEALAANGPNDHRHHIAHLQMISPDDVPRFAELGVTANMQALWAAHEPQLDELTLPFVGPDQAERQYLFGDLLRSGARLAAGSDWAVSSANPLNAIHVAVNRTLPGMTAPPLLPAQKLDLADAVAAYTIGSAYVNHLDDVTGSIEPGKLADLIVLDRDIFAGPPVEIADAKVIATYVEGERVYPI